MMRTTLALGLCSVALALAACGEKTAGAAKKVRRAGLAGLVRCQRLHGQWLEGRATRRRGSSRLRNRTQGQNEYSRAAAQP